MKEHGATLKTLLEREDVSPDNADKYGGTPLLCAAELGAIDITKMLWTGRISLPALQIRTAKHLYHGQPGVCVGMS